MYEIKDLFANMTLRADGIVLTIDMSAGIDAGQVEWYAFADRLGSLWQVGRGMIQRGTQADLDFFIGALSRRQLTKTDLLVLLPTAGVTLTSVPYNAGKGSISALLQQERGEKQDD